ncbi:MAG: DUF5808 domain-containing protein [bacterium]
MTKQELCRMSADPSNSTRLGFYKCSSDPRWIVPKRIQWLGWTVNIAHPISAKTVGLFLFIAILALAPILLVISRHPTDPKSVLMAVLVSFILVSAACHYFATGAPE